MNKTKAGGRRRVSSARLLLAAGAALVVALVGLRAYPFLVSFEAPGVLRAAVRAVVYLCLVAVVVLPIAAVVRRLMR